MALEVVSTANWSDPDFFNFDPVEVNKGELGLVQAIPIFYIVGAAAVAGATTAYAWLTRDEWTTEQYNDYMSKTFETLKLWDKLGWSVPDAGKNACWKKNASKRVEWVSFMKRFSDFYGKHGKQSVYLPDGIEQGARDFVKELAAWAEWLKNKCGIGLVKPDEDKEFTLEDGLKLGAWVVGGILLLNVISSVRDATGRRYR
jgi:hypothetical protein